ncbi:MAG: glycosyltransferase family 4 protein [Anaerolineae bacterium]|nr:glycosyltransferase family 4 protein [Anaerolineae bacterium]
MKILMLLISYDFPTDIRVEKEARSLLAAGHTVTLVCENRKNRLPRETWRGIDIFRLKPQPTWWRQLNTAALFVTLRNVIWERQIAQIIASEQPDALHVHDLPFVGPGLRLAHCFKLPLVADMHENFPAWLEFRQGLTTNLLEKLAFSPTRFAAYERRVLPRCDAVIAVVEEAAERIAGLGVPAEKITVVGNTEDVSAVNPVAEPVDLPPSALTLLYVGGLGPDRGLETAISAMSFIRRHVPSAQLVIVGDGISRPALEQQAQALDLAQAVRFEGHKPFDQVHSYIQAGDVCLVPHLASPEINTTMPHKLFQYMVMKKPVLVSSAKPLARVVSQTNAGLIFDSGRPESFAEAALTLQDEDLRHQLGENGHQAVLRQYNWQVDGGRLVDLYQRLVP